MALLQALAVIVLGLVVSLAAHQWNGLFENQWLAFAIWIAVCLAIGFIYDRRQARWRRSGQDLPPPPQ